MSVNVQDSVSKLGYSNILKNASSAVHPETAAFNQQEESVASLLNEGTSQIELLQNVQHQAPTPEVVESEGGEANSLQKVAA